MYRSINSVTYASRTNTVVTAPAGIQVGDALVLSVLTASATTPPTPTPPSGFVALTVASGTLPIVATDGSFTVHHRLYGKVADSADAAAANFTITHATCSSQAAMVAVSATTASPFNPAATIANGTGTPGTAPGVTISSAASTAVFVGQDWGNGPNDLAPPTGYTERLDSLQGNTGLLYVATAEVNTGATGNVSMANTNSSGNPWTAALVAVSGPSAGGATIVSPLQTQGPAYAAHRAASI